MLFQQPTSGHLGYFSSPSVISVRAMPRGDSSDGSGSNVRGGRNWCPAGIQPTIGRHQDRTGLPDLTRCGRLELPDLTSGLPDLTRSELAKLAGLGLA